MHREPDVSARPLIIGGMHRSGTSLTASLFASVGIDLGPELLGANASNPAGHFEDLGIQEFHARALASQGLCTEGYTGTARGRVPATLVDAVNDLLAARQRPGVAWGWKEPRTTLFLDFWQERLPEARYVFVFRRPWEVADSLFRRGDETFMLDPSFAFAVWTHYNRLIVDFVSRNPDRCAVFEISQVINDPQGVFAAVRSRLGLSLGRPDRRYQEGLFTRDDSSHRAALVRTLAPEAWRTYEELREIAGVAEELPSAMLRDAALGDCAVLEWARASRAEHAARRLAAARSSTANAVPTVTPVETPAEDRPAAIEHFDRALVGPSALARAVRRASETVLGRLVGASRLLRPSGGPTLIPFPRDDDDEQAARRAA